MSPGAIRLMTIIQVLSDVSKNLMVHGVYDYSLFDKYVEFVMSCGIKKRINCYTLTKFTYYDESSGKDISCET